MTAAKIVHIITRLPGCDGQAADAVSAYTQVKMEDAHKLLKIPKSECPDIWIRLPKRKWPKSLSSMEDAVVPLERTEQGSSASQMTAAKVMDIISRLPGCAGQAADAVSAYTQVEMEDAPKLLKIPKSK